MRMVAAAADAVAVLWPDGSEEQIAGGLDAGYAYRIAQGRGVVERFGRHPHRNPVYGRVSTPEEQAYIDADDFPHVQKDPPPG